jgi:UDP-N-acetylglucosamine--N-acetylmuramyl-(pentapeptide) pyrophosphoryl-undecaprenol N-acetylglucosamine transferase
MMAGADGLAELGLQIIHLAGREDAPAVRSAYDDAGVRATVADFFEEMQLAYAAADLALSRAGALSIAELAHAGVPAILVPYPQARDDHQRANAAEVVRQGWGLLLDQSDLRPGAAVGPIRDLLGDPARREHMRIRARATAQPDAAAEITFWLDKAIATKSSKKGLMRSAIMKAKT